MFFVIVYTLHIGIEHFQVHRESHGRSKLLIYLVATSVLGQHDREPQRTTTNIIDSITEYHACASYNHTIYTNSYGYYFTHTVLVSSTSLCIADGYA